MANDCEKANLVYRNNGRVIGCSPLVAFLRDGFYSVSTFFFCEIASIFTFGVANPMPL